MNSLSSVTPPTVTYSNEIPPVIPKNGNNDVVDFSLTLPEAMYLTFMKNMIKDSLEQKNNLVYLGTSEGMQNDFNGWVVKTFTSKQFTSEELRLVKIVSSVWMKTKALVENILKTDQEIENEKQWQKNADSVMEVLCLDELPGKVFTVRQACFLLTATEIFTINEQKGTPLNSMK